MTRTGIGWREALDLTLETVVGPLATEEVTLVDAPGRVAAVDMTACVDSPSVDAALKDGYAVISAEVATAALDRPVVLRLAGTAAAGAEGRAFGLAPGTTVRVLTGARLPLQADAVVSEEFTVADGERIRFLRGAEPGRNVMVRGTDVAAGDPVVRAGEVLGPGRIGLLAAAGYHRVAVFRRPTVAIVATGDEVVSPGLPLPDGKVYASNMAALAAWCRRFDWPVRPALASDEAAALAPALRSAAAGADAVLTSGGAWTGDRDLVARTLGALGWRPLFHRIRMGPGKAVGFGMLGESPVFVLPGGPPSNMMAFLQIALPGLLKMAGWARPALPTATARAAQPLTGRNLAWTQFVFGTLRFADQGPLFDPLRRLSRLHSLAEANAVAMLPEGCALIPGGGSVTVQLL